MYSSADLWVDFEHARRPSGRRRRLRKRQARIGGELPAPHHDHNAGGGERQRKSALGTSRDSRARKRNARWPRLKWRPASAHSLRCAMRKVLRRRAVFFRRRRRRADHDGEIIVQPVRPCEFEEGVDEDDGEPHHLHLPHFLRLRDAERQRRHQGQYLVGRTQQRQRSADGDQAGGGEERGAVLQTRR